MKTKKEKCEYEKGKFCSCPKEVSNLAKECNVMSEENKKEDSYFLFRMDGGSRCEYIGEFNYTELMDYIDKYFIEQDEILKFKIIKGKNMNYKFKMEFEEEI